MNRFERMIAIPEDEYSQMRSLQHVKYPLETHFQSLSNEYKRQDAIQDPYTRVHRQGETLEEMIKVKDLLRQRLLEATPKPYQSRAESLFNYMKDKMKVNEKGEIFNDDGQIIEGSNISDLVQHAVRDRRRNLTPVGWKTFVTQLIKENVPKMLMNYDTLEELSSPHTISNLSDIPSSTAVTKSSLSTHAEIKREPKERKSRGKIKQEALEQRKRNRKESFSPSKNRAGKRSRTKEEYLPRASNSRVKKRPTYLKDYV